MDFHNIEISFIIVVYSKLNAQKQRNNVEILS